MVVSTTPPPPRPAASFPAPGTYLRAWGRAWERVAAGAASDYAGEGVGANEGAHPGEGAGGRVFFEPLAMDDGSMECVPRVELCGAENPQPSWPVAELGRFQRANLALGEFSIHFAFNADIERVLAADWALSAEEAAVRDCVLEQRIPPEWEACFALQQLRFHEVALPSHRRSHRSRRSRRPLGWEISSQIIEILGPADNPARPEDYIAFSYLSFDVGEFFTGHPLGELSSTWSFFGDDAGDYPRSHLLATELPELAQPDQSRIYRIVTAEDWVTLVERYPLRIPLERMWSPETLGDLNTYTVNWTRARRDYDAVDITIAGAVRTMFSPLPACDGYTMLTGCTPGSRIWLRVPETLREEAERQGRVREW
ncbi:MULTISPECIES: hypothetical protein [Actinotignum]|uniref:DUF1963 domain-containing protein n=1 Tax=Actinotignum timonense TaxID=1870995 RepID=A0AAW9HCT1_9ACTO|nr:MULTISPECIES: hypothetical protein [Actinotignum]MDE1557783.1 hypothetical protein [Actinotignum schaalii]MDE1663717.1 hypothetical protein [Actinotignum schaalii]MDK6374167.1 hypothetical protein [Actinotignum timonense]MDK6418610.1 hypothetical protein [Actinotignum timonense]MDK6644381.1 hypothetical protein [Actinotignum timonense]